MISENPSSTAGVTQIVKTLMNHCPVNDDKLAQIACHGDGLSVERMLDCQKHNATGETSFDRLEGVLPVPQDFHKRIILMQVVVIILNA